MQIVSQITATVRAIIRHNMVPPAAIVIGNDIQQRIHAEVEPDHPEGEEVEVNELLGYKVKTGPDGYFGVLWRVE